jgi:hypothetical protein
MAGKNEKMKDFKAKREKLVAEIVALQNQLKAWDEAIALLEGENTPVKPPEIKQRGKNVKETVLTLVENAGADGINAAGVLDAAKSMGVHLDRGSVSSLLSRLKRENVLAISDGGRYFVPASQPLTH